MNIINRMLMYYDYKRNLKRAMNDIGQKYGFTLNYFGEFYTVLDLNDAPDSVIDEYGVYWNENEINKFLILIKNEMDKFDIHEELSLREITKLDENVYGIAFGFKNSIFNPRRFFISKILIGILLIILGLIIIL